MAGLLPESVVTSNTIVTQLYTALAFGLVRDITSAEHTPRLDYRSFVGLNSAFDDGIA